MIIQKIKIAIFLTFGVSLNVFSQLKVCNNLEKLETYLDVIHLKKHFNGEILVAMDCGKFIADTNNMLLTITSSNNNLYAQLAGRPPLEIYFKGNHQFFGKKVEIEFAFNVKNDTVVGLKAERLRKIYYFKTQN